MGWGLLRAGVRSGGMLGWGWTGAAGAAGGASVVWCCRPGGGMWGWPRITLHWLRAWYVGLGLAAALLGSGSGVTMAMGLRGRGE